MLGLRDFETSGMLWTRLMMEGTSLIVDNIEIVNHRTAYTACWKLSKPFTVSGQFALCVGESASVWVGS